MKCKKGGVKNHRWAALLNSAVAVLLAVSINTAFAENLFEVNPTSQMLYSKGGTRHYECSGNISGDVLDAIKKYLDLFSKEHDLTPPQKDLCEYLISTIEVMGRNQTVYTVAFYVDEANYTMCRKYDRCVNTRWATFKAVNNALATQYYLTNDDNSETKFVCFFKNKKGKYGLKDSYC